LAAGFSLHKRKMEAIMAKTKFQYTSLKPLVPGIMLASACVVCPVFYATSHALADVEADGYFDNGGDYIEDKTLIVIQANAHTDFPEVSVGFLRKTVDAGNVTITLEDVPFVDQSEAREAAAAALKDKAKAAEKTKAPAAEKTKTIA
jgi:hypothetical protein